MPDAKTSGAQPNAGNAKSRDHNQGRQDREFTPAQKAAVDRVRKCKPTAYYEILDIKVEATDAEVKKAYRRLALIMHPDKNGAPGADEAFKLISRAFQVLSDEQKRKAYDRTGGDPDSRFGGGESSGGGGGRGNPFEGGGFGGGRGGPMFADEISPEDLFNMFFGGGGLGGGFQGGLFSDGPGFVNFGGPGIRVHQFGGPRVRRRPAAARPGGGPEEGEEPSLARTITQLLPLIILFILPILSSLWSESTSGLSSGPSFKFTYSPPHVTMRQTPKHKIPYYVNPSEVAGATAKKLNTLDKTAELRFVTELTTSCNMEVAARQRRLEEARGWFFNDPVKERAAREMRLPSCDRLRELGVQPRSYY